MSICFCGTLDACLRLAMLRLISTPLAARGLIGSVFCETFLFVGCTDFGPNSVFGRIGIFLLESCFTTWSSDEGIMSGMSGNFASLEYPKGISVSYTHLTLPTIAEV